MSGLDDLLAVQALDTTIGQLQHRLDSLPQRSALRDAETALDRLDAEAVPLVSRREELVRSQKRVEDEVAGIEAKVAEEDARLYSGSITAARELQDVQSEIDGLRRRQSDLETEILEIMDLTEPVDEQLAEIDERRVALRAEVEAVSADLAAAEAGLAAELREVETARAEAAAALDGSLLERYDRLRVQLRGTAVARLTGTTCGACHLGLPAVDVDRLRRAPAGEVPSCPECGAILVV